MGAPQLVLLTHERELDKPTNTGGLVREVLGGSVRRVLWRRTEPDRALLATIGAGEAGLLWPTPAAGVAGPSRPPRVWIVIDATWQQARKIYNRSSYLQRLPTLALKPGTPSAYTLRRNQIPGGLCTAEAVACLLTQRGAHVQAAKLGAALARRFADVDPVTRGRPAPPTA